MAAEEDPFAEKRAKILTASLETSNEPGWGYFGVAGSLAIGDNSYAPRLVRKPAGEEAEPQRNILTAPLKKGAATDVYFEFAPPLCIGDPYKEAEKKGRVWMIDPDAKFKPPGKVRESTNKLGYQYVDHCDSLRDPKAIKEKYGGDYVPPRQIYTNPARKGGGGVYTRGVLFGLTEDRDAVPEHMADDYDRPRQLRLKELEEHKSKMQDTPFKSMDYGNNGFSSNIESFCYDVPTHIPRERKPDNLVIPHEQKFKPANPMKKGVLQGLIGGIPEYMDDPVGGGAKRKAAVVEPPAAFHLGAPRAVHNPMPSVTTNMRNMRNERPSSFARPIL